MSEMKWTPGPWRRSTHAFAHVETSDGRRSVANCGGYSTNTDKGEHIDENEANATLCAAAPNLYEALESVLEYFDHNPIHECRFAYAALAKARGEQP